jgi:hypothetical protein
MMSVRVIRVNCLEILSSFSPDFQGEPDIKWYYCEAVQCRLFRSLLRNIAAREEVLGLVLLPKIFQYERMLS